MPLLESLDGFELSAPFTFQRKGLTTHVETIQVSFDAIPEKEGEENASDPLVDEKQIELLESIVALYHHCLPRLGRKYLRNLLRNPRLKTIVLLRSEQDVLDELARKAVVAKMQQQQKESKEEKEEDNDAADDEESATDCDQDVEETDSDDDDDDDEEGDKNSSFSYGSDAQGGEENNNNNDNDDDDDDDDDDEEEQKKRAEERERMLPSEKAVKYKARILGCLTWEEPDTPLHVRIRQVTLISVRLKFQGYALAHRLMKVAQCPQIVGAYDALVTFADTDAIQWFKRQGFTDDLIINSRFAVVLDSWDCSTLMTCIPPPSVDMVLYSPFSEKEDYRSMKALDSAIDMWRQRRVDEYAEQLTIMERMRKEICHLREKTVKQDLLIDYLTAENQKTKKNYAVLEKEYLNYRRDHPPPLNKGERAAATTTITQQLVATTDLGIELDAASGEFIAINDEICSSVQIAHGIMAISVESIIKCQKERKDAFMKTARESGWEANGPMMRLFLGLPSPLLYQLMRGEACPDLLQDPYGLNEFGKGSYFTRYASKAHHYTSGEGRLLLLCLVALGRNKTIVNSDFSRESPPSDADSICVPGRRLPLQAPRTSTEGHRFPCFEEYVVFNREQFLPLYLIKYKVDYVPQK